MLHQPCAGAELAAVQDSYPPRTDPVHRFLACPISGTISPPQAGVPSQVSTSGGGFPASASAKEEFT